jgi:hypothetical protein
MAKKTDRKRKGMANERTMIWKPGIVGLPRHKRHSIDIDYL